MQFKAIRSLKEHSPEHYIILQIDFAENYSCNTVEEISCAYFNEAGITIHPVVGYYDGSDGA